MRYIVLDTETTGLDPDDGHKIIEIGCIEILNREVTNNTFHKYINPNREIDTEASKIHGLTNNVLKDKPLFEEIYSEFREYVSNSPIIIHNAPFDIGFLKKEHATISAGDDFLDNEIIDSLKLARKISPGKKNTLDALCERYAIDNSDRTLHGALLDAKLLAFVYLKMTIGQNHFSDLTSEHNFDKSSTDVIDDNFKIIEPSDEDKELNLNYFNDS
ncbi:MAG: DNA polymerase III subunit epsilon [Pseudomonadota bacterium]|nr:DNA polymerase III subunit epsilon [Pseudomonadota bacterium]